MLLVENGRHVAVAGFLSTVVNRILEKQIMEIESFELIKKKLLLWKLFKLFL